VVLEGSLLELIERRADLRRPSCPFVFHRNGHPLKDIHKPWDRARRLAGLHGLHFHDLRRSGIRNLVRAGVPERVAMAISGHRTRSVFDRYNITSRDDLREAMQKASAYVTERRTEQRRVEPIFVATTSEHGQNTDNQALKKSA
jgi:integrase